ncbi:MAG: hypothetical protein MZW92_60745 [Comamonadaceae bacterium]|nr:hypothetical protein [Comamonadaceae bacterium]
MQLLHQRSHRDRPHPPEPRAGTRDRCGPAHHGRALLDDAQDSAIGQES